MRRLVLAALFALPPALGWALNARVYSPVTSGMAQAMIPAVALYQPPAGALSEEARLLSNLSAMRLESDRAEALAPLVRALAEAGVGETELAEQAPAERLNMLRAVAEDALKDARAEALTARQQALAAVDNLAVVSKAEYLAFSRLLLGRLEEINRSYGPYLTRDDIRASQHAETRLSAAVEDAARRAQARLMQGGKATAHALGGRGAVDPSVAALYAPRNAAVELFMRATRKKVGWRPHDLESLLVGFGFVLDQRTKHAFYRHPLLPDSEDRIGVPGHAGDLPNGYVTQAMALIRKLYARLGLPTPDEEAATPSRRPASARPSAVPGAPMPVGAD